ncbi:MAG TPA: DUF937 domain-containing protein [Rudaea sp.]|uniref:DUF937 domain-containing protein n=1 Tax=Rudaea sp. TaxID=2136325 RepID=UPI002F957925
MSGLVDTVMGHLGSDQINAIASQLGTDPDSARNAIEHALPLIVGGMAHSASTPDGAGALHSALSDHAGSSISDVLGSVLGSGGAAGGGGLGGMLGGLLGGGSAGAGSGIGGAILGHVFGGNLNAANQGLGQTTGLGTAGAGQLLAILAPIVMSVLANQSQQQGLSPGGLGNVLGQQSQQIQQQGGLAGGLLSAVLGHSGGQLDLSSLIQGAGGLLNAFSKR